MKKLISLGILSALALSLLAGCSAQAQQPDRTDTTNQKLVINFEGRVTAVEDGSVTLDSGKTVRVGEQTSVKGFDGSAAEIAVGDYIQGYAADPDAAELEALRVLVTIL